MFPLHFVTALCLFVVVVVFPFSPWIASPQCLPPIACKDPSLLEYAVEVSQFAVLTAFDNAVLNRPVNLPDTTELS